MGEQQWCVRLFVYIILDHRPFIGATKTDLRRGSFNATVPDFVWQWSMTMGSSKDTVEITRQIAKGFQSYSELDWTNID